MPKINLKFAKKTKHNVNYLVVVAVFQVPGGGDCCSNDETGTEAVGSPKLAGYPSKSLPIKIINQFSVKNLEFRLHCRADRM